MPAARSAHAGVTSLVATAVHESREMVGMLVGIYLTERGLWAVPGPPPHCEAIVLTLISRRR